MTSVTVFDKQKLKNPPLKIYNLGERILRQPAKRIAKVDANVRQLAKQMLQTMYSAIGIGLAAPQVGINKQLIVVDCEPDNPKTPPMVLINPEILSYGPETTTSEEGCLSVPKVYLDVTRPAEIEVAFKDENGRAHVINASGLLSRVIQHEMDHLKGVMFVDRVENMLNLTSELTKHGFSVSDVKSVNKEQN
jgi:peptide deformylase